MREFFYFKTYETTLGLSTLYYCQEYKKNVKDYLNKNIHSRNTLFNRKR